MSRKIPATRRKAWKIVTRSRESVVGIHGMCFDSRLSQLELLYLVGTTVKPLPGTIGIFCFTSLEAAKRQAEDVYSDQPVEIIEVNGIGRGWNPRFFVTSYRYIYEFVRLYKETKNYEKAIRLIYAQCSYGVSNEWPEVVIFKHGVEVLT